MDMDVEVVNGNNAATNLNLGYKYYLMHQIIDE